jgi:hypothetical protein
MAQRRCGAISDCTENTLRASSTLCTWVVRTWTSASADGLEFGGPMRLTLKDDLPFLSVTVAYQGAEIEIPDVLVDTGSATTILALKRPPALLTDLYPGRQLPGRVCSPEPSGPSQGRYQEIPRRVTWGPFCLATGSGRRAASTGYRRTVDRDRSPKLGPPSAWRRGGRLALGGAGGPPSAWRSGGAWRWEVGVTSACVQGDDLGGVIQDGVAQRLRRHHFHGAPEAKDTLAGVFQRFE